ncbi:carboxymuconolactone decarboxylase family protein [Algibacillus agarilyticus]|uniref:carboxymuconolactone decarboxylase family protein n=1 Tax=Algibacillus agarilyticus TaxID=2234133 RepID=UPI000DD01581|nr:carboxymuconolactone decarboxylase family protein [Algibacillus agarilyticus]
MTLRANYFELAPGAINILMEQEAYLREQFLASNDITVSTWELVKLRVSQINQCAFCIDMHSRAALDCHIAQEKLIGLNAWRDMDCYSTHEQAALAWAEIVLTGDRIENVVYQKAVDALTEKGIVDLTIAVNAISSWNNIVRVFKPKVGSYK